MENIAFTGKNAKKTVKSIKISVCPAVLVASNSRLCWTKVISKVSQSSHAIELTLLLTFFETEIWAGLMSVIPRILKSLEKTLE
jgi:uncharacterized membrane protein